MPATGIRSQSAWLDIVGPAPRRSWWTPRRSSARCPLGMFARPTSRTSIGKVFQERAGEVRRPGVPPLRRPEDHPRAGQRHREPVRVGCWRTAASAAVTSSGSCCATLLNAVLMMLATVKCGAVAGMLNYHQRGDVLAHSIGLLKATTIVAEADLVGTSPKAAPRWRPVW